MIKNVQLLRELNKMDERERLAKIIESENLTAKQFAEEVGVSAGTISNILGGRNKPSMEIYVRILNRFRSISSDWLLLGVGSMYRPNGGVTQTALFGDMKPLEVESTGDDSLSQTANQGYNKPAYTQHPPQPVPQRQIARIIIYYTDGTYEER